MKAIILLALVAVSSASWLDWTNSASSVSSSSSSNSDSGSTWGSSGSSNSWENDSENQKGFQSGKEYVYKYESQVLTGFPSLSKSYGGIKVVGKVRLAFTSSSEVTMQLDDLRVLTLNHEISETSYLLPHKQLTEDLFGSLPSGDSELIINQLRIPIKFTYAEGQMTALQIGDKESNWSIDLKRSIISMLQIRLQPKEDKMSPKLEYNSLKDSNSTSFMYLEPAIEGSCYSSISATASEEKRNMYKVYKTRSFDECVKVNTLYKSTFTLNNMYCDCSKNMDDKKCKCKTPIEEFMKEQTELVKPKTIYEYDIISEDKQTFLIKKCVMGAEYRYANPQTPEHFIITMTNQTLVLEEQKDQISINSRSVSWKSVNQPWSYRLLKQDEENLMLNDEQAVKKVKDLVDEMVKASKEPERFDDHFTLFYQLMESVKICKEQQLSNLFREFKAEGVEHKKWKVFVDACIHANSTVCDKFVMDKVVSKEIDPQEAMHIFVVWSEDKVPTFDLLDQMKDRVLSALERGQEGKWVYHHALMCYGALIHRKTQDELFKKSLCVLEDDAKVHQNNIDNMRKYEQTLESKLSSASTDEDKIALLKSLANVGSIESLPVIQKLIAKTETTAVRVHAIFALEKHCFQNKLKVLQTVTPILANPTEDSELREAAFFIIMQCDPAQVQLIKLIENEQCIEFKTLMVKYLKNLLHLNTADEPKMKERHAHIRHILKHIRPFQMSPNSNSLLFKFAQTPKSDSDIFTFNWLTNKTSPSIPRFFAFQHLGTISGHDQMYLEVGFRAEGLDQILSKMKQGGSGMSGMSGSGFSGSSMSGSQSSSSQNKFPELSILDTLARMSQSRTNQKVKPSITFYIRSNDMDVAFLHLDEQSIGPFMQKTMKNGNINIPVSMYQTTAAKPSRVKQLMSNGMWLVTERIHGCVLDVNGTLNVTLSASGKPQITFNSSEPARWEKKTINTQYVVSGFAQSGITSSTMARAAVDKHNWNITLGLQDRNFTIAVQNVTDKIMCVEMKSYTNTFVLPGARLNGLTREKKVAFKDLRTDNSNRKQLNFDLDALKSVELKAKVEGDVYMPEIFSFVKDRFSMMSTAVSYRKQEVKLTLKPATSSQRRFEFNIHSTNLANEIESSTEESQYYQKDESSKKDSGMSSFFGVFDSWFSSSKKENKKEDSKSWFSKDWESSSQEKESFDNEGSLRPLSLGSMRWVYQGRISSISQNRNLSMIANMTVQYDQNTPEMQSVFSFERPALSGMERDGVMFRVNTDVVFNPSTNEWVGSHSFKWGEKSSSNKKEIRITGRRTPVYQGGECYEQKIYGCKNQFGLVQPIMYNKTFGITFKNTDLINKTLEIIKNANMPHAESVYTTPLQVMKFMSPMGLNSVNVSFLVHPFEGKVDIAFGCDDQMINMTRIYLPFETQLDEFLFGSSDYETSQRRPISQLVPRHNRAYPFSSRDICVVENSKIHTFDSKEIKVPRSDCEVTLFGDCENKKFLVTVKPASEKGSTDEKLFKVILNETKLELIYKPPSTFSNADITIKVNGERKQLNERKQIHLKQNEFKEDEETEGIVQCDTNGCEIKSEKHGVWLSVNSEQVKVEAVNGQKQSMCGLCSAHPDMPRRISDSQAIQMVKDNRVSGDQCNIDETMREGDYETSCSKTNKRKFVNTMMESGFRSCVSMRPVPMCGNGCKETTVRTEQVPVRCVSRKEADRLEMRPTMQGDDQYLNDDRLMTRMFSAEDRVINMPIAQDCY